MDTTLIKEDIILRKLTPDDGKRLTNGIDIAERDVFIGVGDSEDNWYEITEEEYNNILKAKEEEANVGIEG